METVNKSLGQSWLKELGYQVPDTGMASYIESWWNWMCATTAFYDSTVVSDNTTYKVERITMCPGKMICEDWAHIVVNEETTISFAGVTDLEQDKKPDENLAKTNDWLQNWIEESGLLRCHDPLERAFGVGTAGFFLGLKNIYDSGEPNEDAKVLLQWADARHFVPLEWDESGVIAIALYTPVVIAGKPYTQITVHRPGEEGYEILTAFFKGNGQRFVPEGYTTEVKTNSETPTFALFSPAIDNTYVDHSPLGVSVLDRVIGTIKLADGAFDNMWKDIFLGQKMVFMSDSMLKKREDGTTIVPRAEAQQLIGALEGDSINGNEMIQEYNPSLRVSDNRQAINTGLALLGKRAGFGFNYYELDKNGSLSKTAKEVAASGAELLRNAKDHEVSIGAAFVGICTAAVSLAKQYVDSSLADVDGLISVNFGDTVMDDDQTARENDRADVAAQLLPKWKYIEKWHGVTEEEAKQWAGEEKPGIPEV